LLQCWPVIVEVGVNVREIQAICFDAFGTQVEINNKRRLLW